MIRLPVYIVERERRIVRSERTLFAKLGREPTDEEIARLARLPVRQVVEVKEAARTVTSLDKPVGEEQDTSLGDLLASDESGPAEEVELSLQEEALRRALGELPEAERQVLELRYGLTADQSPQTLEQVVERLGISRNRVRRLEAEGLSRLAARREIAALKVSIELS
jgi:RNA polymerase primary sigma factor